MDALRHDILYAPRVLRKDRTYAVAVILTLAVCLGANTAIFTVVRSVLLRPLLYPESDRLVSSYDSFPRAGVDRAGTSVPNYVERRAMGDVFSSAALYQWRGYKVGEGAHASILSPNQLYVSAGYLDALKVPVRRGRLFSDSDSAGAPRVVIVDENLAARFWPDRDPIGRRVYIPSKPEDVSSPGPNVTWLQVVGVVGAVKLRGMEEGENARAGAYYQPYTQALTRGIAWAIRSRGEVVSTRAAVQRALAEIDPEVGLTDVFAMSDRIEKSLNPRRAPMLLSLGFGAVALLLAAIGLYGVLAYLVGQRTREIGIRLALGSDASRILRLVLGEAGWLVALGLAGGFAGAVALRGAIAAQLYGVGALDPRVLLGAAAVLGLTAAVACLGPARRAVQVSPLVALSRQ